MIRYEKKYPEKGGSLFPDMKSLFSSINNTIIRKNESNIMCLTLKKLHKDMNIYRFKTKFITIFCCLLLIQTTLFAQSDRRISIKKEQITLKEALVEIEKQAHMSVAYNESQLGADRTIALNVHNASVEQTLKQILRDTGYSFKIQGKQILIVKERRQEAIRKRITGQVLDSQNAPLIGVNITVKNKQDVGAITDLNGEFKLEVNQGDIIEVSYIGYVTQEFKITDKYNFSIVMAETNQLLNEVVVTALGIKRSEKALAYNVQKVSSKELNSVKSANFINSLVGKVAGVSIQSSAAGMGSATKVVMRGAKSLSKSNNALYVIDGIPMKNRSSEVEVGFLVGSNVGSESAADINPEDIESVSMLTGPSAAALYGYEGANGVILITTKKGVEGKVKVSVSNSTMFSKVGKLYETQNTYGNMSGQFESWGNKLEVPSKYNPKKFFKTGLDVINTITLTTGSKTNQTYVSLSTTNSEGILPNSKYNRYNFFVRNTSTFLKDKLQLDLSANYIIQNNLNLIGQGQYFNPLQAVYLFPRGENFDAVRMYQRFDPSRGINTQYWPYGDEGMALQNPYWTMNKMEAKTSKRRYLLTLGLTYKMNDWMNISGRVKSDNTFYVDTEKRYASTLPLLAGPNGYYTESSYQDISTYADLILSVDKNIFTDVNVNANIGASYDDLQIRGLKGNSTLGNIPNLFTFQNVIEEYRPGVGHNKRRHQTQSVFANLEFNYKKAYYLTLTGRNDWDSNLAYSDKSSFFYPSIGGSIILSELFNLPKCMDYAKIRGSYAVVSTAFGQYLSNPYYEFDPAKNQYKSSTCLPAKHLKPEKSKSWEVGFNAILFKKLRIDATYYHSNTLNQSFNIAMSPSSGYTTALVQAGNVENKGIELSLGYEHKWGDFIWNTNLAYTINRNKVIRLANGAVNVETGEPITMNEMHVAYLGKPGRGAEIILTPGKSMGEVYVRNGLMQDGNNEVAVDENGNLMIEDYKTPKHIGSVLPKYNVGFNNSFSYKGFNVNVVLAARVGGLVTSVTQGILDYYGVSKASAEARNSGGVIVNGFNALVDAKKYYQAIGGGEGGIAQYYMYSATNVRLQEVNLSYSFPEKWFKNNKRLTVGLVGRNILMLYCKAPFDPELSAATSSTFYQGVDYFMQPSTSNWGVNVKFEF